MNKLGRFDKMLFNSNIRKADREFIYDNIDSNIIKILELEDTPTVITGYEIINNSNDIIIKFIKSKETELSYNKSNTMDIVSPYNYELIIDNNIEVSEINNTANYIKYDELSIHDIFKKYIYKLDNILFKIDIIDEITLKPIISCNLRLVRNRFDNRSGVFIGDGKTIFTNGMTYLDSLHGSDIGTDKDDNKYIFGINIDYMGYISLYIQAFPTNKNTNSIKAQHIRFEVLEVEGICSTIPYDEGDIIK